MLRAKGYSVRHSEASVKAVFSCMARALHRGEVVELPIGWMQAVGNPPKIRRWRRVLNVSSRKFRYCFITSNKYRRRIRFKPFPNWRDE